jgi:ech hydrogenase subunit D
MGTMQSVVGIEVTELAEKVIGLKADGYRMVQISCTNVDGGFELTYGFDKNGELFSYRIHISQDTEIQSISSIYFPAFLYENELKDLFGVKIRNIVLDFQGNFYKLAKKTPFNPSSEAAEPKSE